MEDAANEANGNRNLPDNMRQADQFCLGLCPPESGNLDRVILTKCIHSPIESQKDALRILATRLRGHGLPKYRYDVWMANPLGTSSVKHLVAAGKLKLTDAQLKVLEAA